MTPAFLLRVQSVRSQNPFGRGGCIFTATAIDEMGNVVDAKSYFVVKATGVQLGETQVQPGQWWAVVGDVEDFTRTTNGYVIKERQISAQDIALARLSGEHIVTFIADSEDFAGIGLVKARTLWETFGERLYGLLDAADVEALSTVLTPESAECAVAAWAKHGDARTLQWLQSSGIDVRTGKQLLAFFGQEAQAKLEEDPYRLLSFSASWKHVDALARTRFGVAEDDPRRLQAAVEEALYRLFDAGDTLTPIPTLARRVESVLGGSVRRSTVMAALEAGLTNGSYVIGEGGNVHLLGSLVIERTVAASIAQRLSNQAPLLDPAIVARIISDYEQAEGFDLNAQQKAAVHCAAEHPIALILGGAGVGKTTVLKALYKVFDEAGIAVHQMALSGRAAKRMSDATGRPSSTLARFCLHAEKLSLDQASVVVVDEASMVDVITMHRLCALLPDHVRLLLVGDTSQLMPVGPGLVLHALANMAQMPKVELTQVKRYGGVIAEAAAAIRAGQWPTLPDDAAAPISFVPCRVADIPDVVVSLYEADRDNTQIISARKGNVDGTKSLNQTCQERFSKQSQMLLIRNEEFDCDMSTGFHLGDLVLCTKNLWDWGLQNGSLGRLVEIERTPRLLKKPDGTDCGHALAWVEWDDGERRPVMAEMLEDLELGYALTVHKAQGSQWTRVIVVLTGTRMLDRTLVYTAVTRAQNQVILVGDEAAARKAVESLPRAELRTVGLHDFLKQELTFEAEMPQ
jgi:exodeoxyribonuclease V alpha subunit